MAKYLHWRKNSLYCGYPISGWPRRYRLKVFAAKGTKSEKDSLEKNLGLPLLGKIQVAAIDARIKLELEQVLFDIKIVEELKPRVYNPKLWRIVGRNWHYHLRFKKSGSVERYHMLDFLNKFGGKYANEITRGEIALWMNELKLKSIAVNTINNRFARLKAVYRYACSEQDPKYRFTHDPTAGMKKLKGGNVRKFLLTEKKFERNYKLLLNKTPRFALYYLALWETGRRPLEVSLYTWEMVDSAFLDGVEVHFFNVPSSIAKTDDYSKPYITQRLWREIKALGYRTGFVFRNEFGGPWENYDHHADKLKEAFGEDAGWIRDCRRGFVTRKKMIEGHDDYSIMKQTGHKTTSIFKRYLIVDDRDQYAVVNGGIKSPTDVQIKKNGMKMA
jgi:hypothetical protein